MDNKESQLPETAALDKPFKLDYKRTAIIGFAFFGILLLWQVYDSWCPTFLTELFKESLGASDVKEVQYLVGVMMALDNVAALILLPIFGHLSDKTHTKIGKRMPYILIGTFVCAVAFPFIPVFFHYHQLGGTIAMMAIVVTFAMMYRNPAVSLMPDITPKPLRSKANGIINIMGYLGGACATVLGIIPLFVLSSYLGKDSDGNSVNWLAKDGNIWMIEGPFLIASVLMVLSALVLFFLIDENKIEKEVAPELERGEKVAAVATPIDDDKPMTKANKTMLILILIAEFFWFMADNGIGTFMGNYTLYYLHCKTSSNMINTIVGGVGSVIGFAVGGLIAGKIGRKWTIVIGLGLDLLMMVLWMILGFAIPVAVPSGTDYNTFPFYLYIVFGLKGFGMSLVHINSFPMVVELCSFKKIGKFTGYYYASSMAAQSITPCLLGLLLLAPGLDFNFLPIYALCCIAVSLTVFLFVKNVKVDPKTALIAGDAD
ncbi:MAG: MFS transporter [Bacilli bacterium]|jgi:maltose/moltooligosaccharide transporter|nr:MFS transporter [Bacilli bacterium]